MEKQKSQKPDNFNLFSLRIRELYKYIASSYQEFYERTGIPKTSLNSYLKPERPSKPGSDFFLLIKDKFPEIDLNYLFTGKGALIMPLELALNNMYEPEPEYSDPYNIRIIRSHQELMEAHKELIALLHKRLQRDTDLG